MPHLLSPSDERNRHQNRRTLRASNKITIAEERSRRIYGRQDLKWDGLRLRLTTGRLLATVEFDSKWPKMCRVRLTDSQTDMVNLTRAKDAAIGLALGDLNAQETRLAASPVRQNRRAAG
jgi:hypothetical protein